MTRHPRTTLSLVFATSLATVAPAQTAPPFELHAGPTTISSLLLTAADQYGWIFEIEDAVLESPYSGLELDLPLELPAEDVAATLGRLAVRRGFCGRPTDEADVTQFVALNRSSLFGLHRSAQLVDPDSVLENSGWPDQWVRVQVGGIRNLQDVGAELQSCLCTLGIQVATTYCESDDEPPHWELLGRSFEVSHALQILRMATEQGAKIRTPNWLEAWRKGPPGPASGRLPSLNLDAGTHMLADVLQAAGRAQGADYLIGRDLAGRRVTLDRHVALSGSAAVETWLRGLALAEQIHRIPLSSQTALAEWASSTGRDSAAGMAQAALVDPGTALALAGSDLPVMTLLRPANPQAALEQLERVRMELHTPPMLAVFGERFVLRGTADAVVQCLQSAATPARMGGR